MPDLDFASIEELAGWVRADELSPSELLEHTLQRVEALNPRLNAIVALDAERARAAAAAQTERLARGEALGPLGGIPLVVKDLDNLAGFATTYGSRLFRDAPPAEQDDLHVARLRAAGAVPLGKSNTPEFGHLPFTDNEVFGPTRNPWNLERTAGGSSGGAAAALASGMLALATASDGAGSIRIPASYCGLYGLKPAFGRVPIGPRAYDDWMTTTVQGPLTRTVRDAALLLDVMAGPHGADRHSLPAAGYRYRERMEEPLPRLRIAFNRTLGVTRLQADVLREVEAAVATFRDLGHELEENEDAIPEMGGWWAKIAAFAGLATQWENYQHRSDEFGESFRSNLDRALTTDAEDFGTFNRLRQEVVRWTAGLFERYDLLLTPTLPTEAFAAAGPLPLELEGEPFVPIAYTYPFNFTGHPAASVRAGLTDSGLPCGLQIVGPRFREDLVLQASAAYEAARPWADCWPAL